MNPAVVTIVLAICGALSLDKLAVLAAGGRHACGVRRILHGALIKRGSSTRNGDWPWHAAVYHRIGTSDKYVCGGTLINEEYVLTAAHCTLDEETGYKMKARKMFIRLGLHNLQDTTTMQQHQLDQVHTFSNFSKLNLQNDIALLELKSAVTFTDYIVPACINSRPDLTGQIGTSIGWGVADNDELAPELLMANLPVVDSDTCLNSDRDVFGKFMYSGMFCAGHTNGTAVCNGDSGGGLFFERAGVWYLSGIVSFSKAKSAGSSDCAADGYAGFTNVAKYLQWLKDETDVDFAQVERRTTTTTTSTTTTTTVRPVEKPVLKPVQRPTTTSTLKPKPPRLSEKKCLEYQRSSPPGAYSHNVCRDNNVCCVASVISERFLLTMSYCGNVIFADVPLIARFSTPSYNGEISGLYPLLHPTYRSKHLALIDLGRNYDELKQDILCLWTDDEFERESLDSVAPGFDFNISETTNGKYLYTNADYERCQSNFNIIGTKNGESFGRIVGASIFCRPTTFAMVTDYLDWIESIVWSDRRADPRPEFSRNPMMVTDARNIPRNPDIYAGRVSAPTGYYRTQTSNGMSPQGFPNVQQGATFNNEFSNGTHFYRETSYSSNSFTPLGSGGFPFRK